MFGQQVLKDIFYVFYGGVAALNLAACLYLLLRRSNAIAPDITSPPRLRRWAAAFFGASALSHVWNLPVYMLTSEADVMQGYLVAGLLDCMTIGPLALMILIVMLQDRRRPLWPVGVVVAPFVAIMALSVATRSDALMPLLYACFVVVAAGIVAYMAVALKQYGRWLRDNYADLEHKELWQSFLVLAFILSGLGIYTFDIDALTYEYSLQMLDVALICYLLWRVETLSDLSLHTSDIGMANSEESYGGGGDDDIAQASHSEDDDPQTPPAEDGGHSPAIRQRGGKAYTYYFTVESANPMMKCGHGMALAPLLKHPELDGDTGRPFDETFSKTMRRMWVQFAKTGNPSLTADISPDGKDKQWPLYDIKDKHVMVFDEFNIHPEKEAQRKIVDWQRTYFLTKLGGF